MAGTYSSLYFETISNNILIELLFGLTYVIYRAFIGRLTDSW